MRNYFVTIAPEERIAKRRYYALLDAEVIHAVVAGDTWKSRVYIRLGNEARRTALSSGSLGEFELTGLIFSNFEKVFQDLTDTFASLATARVTDGGAK